ncbi:MAG TPA: septum site-determining protein Ssd [Kineosporiaceae bacterium]|nr:septum site-determining protein Ssd [Kineosporiaceae bacterium]
MSVPAGGAAVRPGAGEVVAVTGEPWLADRLSALAEAAGIGLHLRSDLPVGWSSRIRASLILVGAEVDPGGERRDGVVLVCGSDPEPEVWRRAIACGAEQVVVLPDGEPWLLDRIVDAVSPPPTAAVLGVIGGRGGAGASTLAVGLASVATRSGVRTLLVDNDPLGGGLDLLLGLEEEGGLRWSDLAGARGRLQPGVLASMLPGVPDLRVLTWGRFPAEDAGAASSPSAQTSGPACGSWSEEPGPGAAAVEAVLGTAAREFELIVLDLTRRFGPGDRAASRACRTVFVVVPAEVRATAAAAAVCAQLDRTVADQRLVVRGPAPSGLPADAVADALGLPLAGELRTEPAVATALDRGEALPGRSRGALPVLCRRLLSQVLD